LGEQAVGRARQLGERRLLSAALPHLADAKRLLGDLDSARADLAESLALGCELGWPEAIVESLHLLACVSAAASDFGWTAALFGAGQREAGFGWIPEDPGHAREYEQARAAARHGLGDDQFEKAFAAGQAMSLDAVADYLQSDARTLAAPVDVESALELIADQRQLRMSSFRVVGDYTRFDDSVRQTLVDARQSIVMALAQPGHKRNAHLIWAAPGSGKTYFVQQVAASLPDTAFAQLNLAKSDAATLRTFLADIEAAGGRQLRFIDECDAQAGEAWPYELLLPALDTATAKGLAVVVVLAGSSGVSAEEMQQRMASRPKGADLISRIPHTNVHTIPPLGFGDRMLVAVSQLRDAAAEAGRHISSVERMALFYAMVNPHVASPRQLRELCVRAVERLLPGEERLRYDHLFSPGNPENKAFWMHWQARHRALVGHFVEIED
jgi:predicted AAA+ superfamily ATPase